MLKKFWFKTTMKATITTIMISIIFFYQAYNL
jgi:hypothetical protein